MFQSSLRTCDTPSKHNFLDTLESLLPVGVAQCYACRFTGDYFYSLSHINCEGQSPKTVSTNHNPFEEKGKPKRNGTEVLLLTNLTPYR